MQRHVLSVFYQLQVASDSVGAVAAAARAREADVTFLVQKLAAAEQQLQSNKAAGGVLRAALVPHLPHSPSLRSALLHKAAEAEAAAPSREAAAAAAADAAAAETESLQQVLPLLQSSCEVFSSLHANMCQVRVGLRFMVLMSYHPHTHPFDAAAG